MAVLLAAGSKSPSALLTRIRSLCSTIPRLIPYKQQTRKSSETQWGSEYQKSQISQCLVFQAMILLLDTLSGSRILFYSNTRNSGVVQTWVY